MDIIKYIMRKYWSIESIYYHLNVTFHEDKNTKIDKIVTQNFNIIKKWSLSL